MTKTILNKFISSSSALYLCLFIPFLLSFSKVQTDSISLKIDEPIEVSITLRINKIYNINSVNETYQIDGYLLYSWNDQSAKFLAKNEASKSIIYENESAREIMASKLFIPSFELINVHGGEEVPDIRIQVYSDGLIELEKRFFGTFSANMDYKKFPFDTQSYLVEIEPFSYGSKKIVFTNPKLFLEEGNNGYLGEDWEFISSNKQVTVKQYQYMDDDINSEKNMYSRVVFEVRAKRLSGYYQWQVLFPLLIIILASFAIFWVKEFSSQISVGFTLMLTVVAFNFYSASILPKLPYNTFIEYVIIVGYIFIFLGIIAVIANNRINGIEDGKDKAPLLKYFRVGFPLLYIFIMMLLYVSLIV